MSMKVVKSDFKQNIEYYREAYLEQDETINTIVFKCKNGKTHRCSPWILLQQSQHFTDKLGAYDRFDNKTEFDYEEFNKEAIQHYLDILHGINSFSFATDMKLQKKLEMLLFLKSEGKSDVSPFERRLYHETKERMGFNKMSLEVKIIFSLICEQEFWELFETTRVGEISYAGQNLDPSGENKTLFELILAKEINESNQTRIQAELNTMMLNMEIKLLKKLENLKPSNDLQSIHRLTSSRGAKMRMCAQSKITDQFDFKVSRRIFIAGVGYHSKITWGARRVNPYLTLISHSDYVNTTVTIRIKIANCETGALLNENEISLTSEESKCKIMLNTPVQLNPSSWYTVHIEMTGSETWYLPDVYNVGRPSRVNHNGTKQTVFDYTDRNISATRILSQILFYHATETQ